MDLKRGMDAATDAIISELQKNSKIVKSDKEVQQVGTIASNGDGEVGGMISEAMQKVGKEGVITVEEGKVVLTKWLSNFTKDREFMISSDKILTMADPAPSIVEKYMDLSNKP